MSDFCPFHNQFTNIKDLNKNINDKITIIKEPIKKPIKKHVFIVSSIGGGGHIAVSKALAKYLKDDYDVIIMNAFEEVMRPIDSIKTITFGTFSGEDFYNICLQYKWTWTAGIYSKIGGWFLRRREKTIESLWFNYLKNAGMDIVISVMPFINAGLLKACQRLNLPFLIITNDLDTTNYVNGIVGPTYKKFYYTLAFDDTSLRKKIELAKIPKGQIKITGFPLRPDFFKSDRNISEIKKKFSVPTNKKVVMILMGGAGSLATYKYVKHLAEYDKSIHIIACLGRNENLHNSVKKINLAPNISITILGFTEDIADLMAISDVLITKPGPGSICESIASSLPMIVDLTDQPLWWEVMNIELVKKNQFGAILTNYNDLDDILDQYLYNEKFIKNLKEKMIKFREKKSFEENLKNLLKLALA